MFLAELHVNQLILISLLEKYLQYGIKNSLEKSLLKKTGSTLHV